MFDAKAYLATIERPQFRDPSGTLHVGILVGTDTWLGLQQLLRRGKQADGTFDSQLLDRAMFQIVTAFFPKPWWKVWERSVAWHIWRLPPIGRMKAVWDFMESHAKAMGDQTHGTFPTLPGPSPDGPSPDSPTPGSLASSTSDSPVSTTPVAADPGPPTTAPSPTASS